MVGREKREPDAHQLKPSHAAPVVALDHLVIAAARLEDGIAWVADQLGASVPHGGRHAIMNTHNAVARIAAPDFNPGVYLEVIAIDPDAGPAVRPRWFGLDDPLLQARLANGPFLHHWVVRTPDLAATLGASPADLGDAVAMRRDHLQWEIAVRGDGSLPFGGLHPTCIQWPEGPHVSERMAETGVTLLSVQVTTPESADLDAALGAIGANRFVSCVAGEAPRLIASFRRADGRIVELGR
jgi:Glyoxalase-like domain